MRMPRIVLAAAASGSGKTTVTCGILKAPADRGITAASFKCGPDYIDPLIVDCRSMSLSIVPVIKGFLEYKENSHIRGVILNRISPSLYERMKPVIEEELSIRVLGYLPYNREIALESRHLGLVTPDDAADTGEKFDRLAKLCEETVRMDDLIRLAEEASDMEDEEEEPYGLNGMQTQSGRRVRIAVSKDEAFCFWYEENLRLLSELGAEPVEFSPLRDPGLPEGASGLWLCGGFLYLQERLMREDGNWYPMAGALKGDGYRAGRLTRFGYAEITANRCRSYQNLHGIGE